MSSPLPDGNVTTYASASTATSHTFAHNNNASGSNIALIAIGKSNSGNNTAFTGVTYAGNSLTQIVSVVGARTGGGIMYYQAAPATGSNNVVVSAATAKHCNMGVFQLKDVAQSSPVDTTGPNESQASGTSETNAVTTTVDNSIVIFWILLDGATTGRTPDSGETEIFNFNGSGDNDDIFCSYIEKATAGSETMGVSWTTSVQWDCFITSLKYAAPAASTFTPRVMVY